MCHWEEQSSLFRTNTSCSFYPSMHLSPSPMIALWVAYCLLYCIIILRCWVRLDWVPPAPFTWVGGVNRDWFNPVWSRFCCQSMFGNFETTILFLSSINSRNFICLWANILWQDIHHDGRPAKWRSYSKSSWWNIWLHWKGKLLKKMLWCMWCEITMQSVGPFGEPRVL